MVLLSAGNYQGTERRNGNGKLKLSFAEYLKLFTLVVTVFVSGVIGWMTIKGNVKANAAEIAEASTEIHTIKDVNESQNGAILTLQSDVQHIREAVKDIKITQKDSQKLLYKILGALGEQ